MAERWHDRHGALVVRVPVALTWSGSAFHRPGRTTQRAICGAFVRRVVAIEDTELDYCRRCWGSGAFVRVA